MEETEELQSLIYQYLKSANEAAVIIEEIKEKYPWYINDIGMEVTDLPMSGEFPEKGIKRYKFHGTGCRVTFSDDAIVDFNFEMSVSGGKKIRGVDPWFLAEFIASKKEHSQKKISDYEYLKDSLNELVKQGKMMPPGSLEPFGYFNQVYYFKKDFDLFAKERPWGQ